MGARTHITCPNCYHRNPLHLLYCDSCGSRLERSGTDKLGQEASQEGDRPITKAFSLPSRRPGDTGELDPDQLPEWLRTGEMPDKAAAGAGAEDEPAVDPLAEADDSVMPDWLTAGLEADEERLDEVGELAQSAEAPALEGETVPEWLDATGEASGGSPEDGAEPETDWATLLEGEGEASTETPESPRKINQDELKTTDWISHFEQLGELPPDQELEFEPPGDAADAETIAVPESEAEPLPDWLAAEAADDPVTLPESAAETELELGDWLKLTSDAEAVDPETAGEDGAEDHLDSWLAGLEEGQPEDSDLDESAELTAEEGAADLPTEEGLTSWLAELEMAQEPNEAGAGLDDFSEISDLPAEASDEDAETEEGLTGWLAELEMPEETEAAAGAIDDLPDLTAEAAAGAGEAEGGLTGWLAELEMPEETEAAAGAIDDLPDLIAEESAADQPVAEGVTGWLSELEKAEDAVSETAEEDLEGLAEESTLEAASGGFSEFLQMEEAESLEEELIAEGAEESPDDVPDLEEWLVTEEEAGEEPVEWETEEAAASPVGTGFTHWLRDQALEDVESGTGELPPVEDDESMEWLAAVSAAEEAAEEAELAADSSEMTEEPAAEGEPADDLVLSEAESVDEAGDLEAPVDSESDLEALLAGKSDALEGDDDLFAELVAMRQGTSRGDRPASAGMADVPPDWLREAEKGEKQAPYRQVGGPLHGMVDIIPIAPAVARPVEIGEATAAPEATLHEEDRSRAALFEEVLAADHSQDLVAVPRGERNGRAGSQKPSWKRVILLLLLFVIFLIFLGLYFPELLTRWPLNQLSQFWPG